MQLTQLLLTHKQITGAFACEIHDSENSVSNLLDLRATQRETVAKTCGGSVRFQANIFPMGPNLTRRPLHAALG